MALFLDLQPVRCPEEAEAELARPSGEIDGEVEALGEVGMHRRLLVVSARNGGAHP